MTRGFQTAAMRVALAGVSLWSACEQHGTGTTGDIESHRQPLLTAGSLLATATLDQATDFSPITGAMENGLPQNVLGGLGSGLAWAGGTTFLAVPDRGPNATAYTGGTPVDNTVSFISRFETVDLSLSPAASGSLPFTLVPTLKATTLLFADTPLVYGNTFGLPNGAPAANSAGRNYFTGRSDNFGAGLSTDPSFARFDPECIRVSRDGLSVFVGDEYGPYIYQFDRATGRRLRAYTLPNRFAVSNLYALGASEISGNTVGRVTNKGIEGLAITPDGTTLVALVQSPLLQDGGDGGRANRIVTIDVASGATHEYVYDNKIGSKAFNSSEIIAFNNHQFLIDTRDGKGLGDGSVAVVKQLWVVDIASADDVSALSGEAALLAHAAPKQLFLDLVAALVGNGVATNQIPAKIEGLAFGTDVVRNGVVTHTLFVANDNDFVPAVAGPNRWYVFGFTDADLAAMGISFSQQEITERGPDLALSKTASASTVVTGTDVTYTLSVANNGLVPSGAATVTDTLPPQLSLVACQSAGTCGTSASGPTVSFAGLAATGTATATLSATLSCSVADGTTIVNQASVSTPAGDTTADNAAAAAIVAVNPPPSVSAPAASPAALWPPNKKMQTVTVAYDVRDNCAGTVCSLSVTSTEGSASDWQIVDAHTVALRADRNGNGPGRTYAIAVTCVDSGGAVNVKTATVTVPHNQ